MSVARVIGYRRNVTAGGADGSEREVDRLVTAGLERELAARLGAAVGQTSGTGNAHLNPRATRIEPDRRHNRAQRRDHVLARHIDLAVALSIHSDAAWLLRLRGPGHRT